MHETDDRPIFVTRKVFARRLATRLLASAGVMVALSFLSHPESPDTRIAEPAAPALSSPSAVAGPPAPVELAALPAAATPAVAAPQRTERLHRNTASASARTAAVRTEIDGVLLFDRCGQPCDSRDPLLAVERIASRDAAPEPVSYDEWDTGGSEASRRPEIAVDRGGGQGLVASISSDLSSVAETGVRAGGRAVGAGLGMLTPW